MMKILVWSVLAALSLSVPMLAYAADGYVTGNVNLRAGPDPSYPLVDQIEAGTEVDVQGCTEGWEWCDVIAYGNRGWVAGNYIQYDYQDQQVLLPAYGAQIGIPIVTFALGAYWDNYYRGRPFYRERDRWYGRSIVSRPPPRPVGRPFRGPPIRGVPGQLRPDDRFHGVPGSGYQRPGHLGPVSPGHAIRPEPFGQQHGNPAQFHGDRPQAPAHGQPTHEGSRGARPTEHKEDHGDNGGH
jgi:uncharacterized protein YraI